jgi:hypothetical protein
MTHTVLSRTKKAQISFSTLVRRDNPPLSEFRLPGGLERTLGGLDVFLPYVKDYVNTYMGKSITSDQWKSHLYSYFTQHGGEDKVRALNSVDWDVGVMQFFDRLIPTMTAVPTRHGFTAKDSNYP